MKILWHSTNPLGFSGYCRQTALFAPLINQLEGKQVTISGYTYRGGPIEFRDCILISSPGNDFGSLFAYHHYKAFESDMVISLTDPFALRSDIMGNMEWAAWAPIDSKPMKHNNLSALEKARWVLAMSQFGYEEARIHFDDSKVFYIPHGIDPDEYHPIDRQEARQSVNELWSTDEHSFDLKDRFFIVSTMANVGRPARKNFAALIEAFSIFLKEVDSSALLYIHTNPEGGEKLKHWAHRFKIPEYSIVWPNIYFYETGRYRAEDLNVFYNAAHLYIQSSRNEGFGIPIVEAQASGCPVIVTDSTSMPELAASKWVIPGDEFHYFDGSSSVNIDVRRLYQQIKRVYNMRNKDKYLEEREKAAKFAESYHYNNVMPYWDNFLKVAEAGIRLDKQNLPEFIPNLEATE